MAYNHAPQEHIGEKLDHNFERMIKSSMKDRAKGNLSGGYMGGANHPATVHKAVTKNRKRVRAR